MLYYYKNNIKMINLLNNLDHITIKTNNLANIKEFYINILGLEIATFRPNFKFNGVWLKLQGKAILHVIETKNIISLGSSIDHFAFSGISLEKTKNVLNKNKISFNIKTTPDNAITQIFLLDPDGNRIEITFR